MTSMVVSLGYNKFKVQFLKIFLYNPKDVRKHAFLLSNGYVNSYKFKCYESHIDYDIKFFKDNNLGGFKPLTIVNYSQMSIVATPRKSFKKVMVETGVCSIAI